MAKKIRECNACGSRKFQVIGSGSYDNVKWDDIRVCAKCGGSDYEEWKEKKSNANERL